MGDQFTLKNNQIFVLAEAAGGVYNSDQLRILCEVADSESAFLKITEDQRIGFMVDPQRLADVQAQVRKSGLLLRSYKSSGVPSPRACLGELCTFAHQPSLGDALELTTHLLKSFPSPKRYSTIGVNGCHRACLGSSTEDIHIVAEESGYKISIGGKGSDIPQQAQLILENISRTDLPVVIEKILAVFYQESHDDERIVDVIERIGLSPFFNTLPDHIVPIHTEQNVSQPEATPDTGTDKTLDDLLATTAAEFDETNAPALIVNDETFEQPQNQTENLLDKVSPLAELQDADVDIELPNEADESIEDSLVGDLLEVADSDLEEGSSEDVERVREAIRTELAMTNESDQEIAHQTDDLLDELDEGLDGGLDVIDPFESNEGPVTDLEGDNTDLLAEFNDEGVDSNNSDLLASSEEIQDDFVADTAAQFEHQKTPTRTHRAENIEQTPPPVRNAAAPEPMGGRLSIKFIDEQLAVELPSGMSFELPFESVVQGGELEMSLPDGNLRIRRDGQLLSVQLGLINLKIPIPKHTSRNAA